MIAKILFDLSAQVMTSSIGFSSKYLRGKITKASDDPVVAMKGMQYRTQLAQVNQYQRNVSQGFTWLENSESSVNSETDIMGKIRDLMVQAKSDSNGETELKAIGTEI